MPEACRSISPDLACASCASCGMMWHDVSSCDRVAAWPRDRLHSPLQPTSAGCQLPSAVTTVTSVDTPSGTSAVYSGCMPQVIAMSRHARLSDATFRPRIRVPHQAFTVTGLMQRASTGQYCTALKRRSDLVCPSRPSLAHASGRPGAAAVCRLLPWGRRGPLPRGSGT